MLLNVAGSFFAILFGGWLLRGVVLGLRTGRIHHTNSTATYSRRTQPVRFTLVAIFFMALAVMLHYAAAERLAAIWHSFVR